MTMTRIGWQICTMLLASSVLLASMTATGRPATTFNSPPNLVSAQTADTHNIIEHLRLADTSIPVLAQLPIADRGAVAIEVTEREVFTPLSSAHLDNAPIQLSKPAPRFYRGRVVGHAGSIVALSLAADGQLTGLVSMDGAHWAVGRDAKGETRALRVEDANTSGFNCGVVNTSMVSEAMRLQRSIGPATALEIPVGSYYQITLAIESDAEFLNLFSGDTALADSYVGSLVNYITAIYEEQVQARFVLGDRFYWSAANDPWQENSSLSCRLREMGRYWRDNREGVVDYTTAHFLSGAFFDGGLAWLDTLCQAPSSYADDEESCSSFTEDPTAGVFGSFGISSGLTSNGPSSGSFLTQNSFFVAHELGHSVGSSHSHCYGGVEGVGDPVDACYTGETSCWAGGESLPGVGSLTGGSANQQTGTIMSYCHLQSGGTQNIAPSFGKNHDYGVNPERVTNLMAARLSAVSQQDPSCLPVVSDNTSNPQTVTVEVLGGGSGSVSSAPSGISCPNTCSAQFGQGALVQFTASPSAGNVFAGWGGACAGTEGLVCEVSVNSGLSLSATFESSQVSSSFDSAVDNPGLGWSTGGDADWFAQSAETWSGAEALQSGEITSGETSWAETVLTGPGNFSFRWKIDSASADTLQLLFDGSVAEEISGSGNWSSIAYSIPNGEYRTQWRFNKNTTSSVGANAGYLDAVVFDTDVALSVNRVGNGAVISDDGAIDCGTTCSGIVAANAPVTLTATPAAGERFVGWGGDCTSTASTCFFQGNSLNIDYGAVIVAVFDNDASDIDLAQALDSSLSFTTGGDRAWRGQNDVTSDGIDAAESGLIGDLQSSWMETTIVGPGQLSFDWRVSSEIDYDFLRLQVNGVTQASISGETDWASYTLDVPSGEQTIRWVYVKDDYVTEGTDRGWVDNVTFASNEAITVTIEGVGYGAVEESAMGFSCATTNGECALGVSVGDTVTFSANPESDSYFVGWSGACSGTGNCSFTVSGETAITAAFGRSTVPSAPVLQSVDVQNRAVSLSYSLDARDISSVTSADVQCTATEAPKRPVAKQATRAEPAYPVQWKSEQAPSQLDIAQRIAARPPASITVDGVSYSSTADYVASAAFRDRGGRCGTSHDPALASVFGGAGAKSPADCSTSNTTISVEYADTSVVYRIPVWFHVIYDTNDQGLLEQARLERQIAVLNEDFRAMAPDMNNSSDMRVEFYLAGVDYTQNDSWFNDNNESAYKSALAVDPSRYLNIYTNKASDFLGYAYFPHGGMAGSSDDGVTMLWEAIGGRNEGTGDYNQGRTLAHEIGHYLGLDHTFAGETCSNTYTTGDLLVDTPAHRNASYSCASTLTDCGEQTPIFNIMNYGDDACLVEFTPEQANRTACILQNYRPTVYEEVVTVFSTDTTLDYGYYSCTVTVTNEAGESAVSNALSFEVVDITRDTDGDGTPDVNDADDDNDGVPDVDDAFPLDDSESADTDGDGTGNNADTDDDNDGVPDSEDAFPLDATETEDFDGDGIGDNADTDDDNDGVSDGNDAFPYDDSESADTDGDGIGNNADTDDDNDGVPDDEDAFPLDETETEDFDGDGIGDNADTDDDNDGIPDSQDVFPFDGSEALDTDGDGIGNNADTDDDNDGVPDDEDALPLDDTETEDFDGDGIGDNADTDDDNDGVSDDEDAFPFDDSESADTDGDGIGNNADTDDDNDGVPDDEDALPLDETETEDFDGDGIGDNADTDDDNDGVSDDEDAFPFDDGESADTDGDGTGNNADTDDDNDGVSDEEDAFPLDDTESVDTDEDGVGDNADAYPEDALRSRATERLVSIASGENGSVDALEIQVVEENQILSFSIIADDGFEVDAVSGSCPGTLSGTTFTTDPIVDDCDISVSFKVYVAPPRCEGPNPCVPQIIGLTDYDAESMSADVTIIGAPESEPAPLEYTTWCASEALPDYTQLVVESVVNPQDDITTTIPLAASGEPPYLCYFTAANGAGSSEAPNYVDYDNIGAFNHVTLMAPDDFRETIQGKIQLMYIGLLQRAADRTGLAYWSRTFYNGASVDAIRASFVPLEEFQSFWGDRTRGEFLTALYLIYFNREPDPEGFEYWNTGGGSGNPVDQLAQIFIDAASIYDQVVLENKAKVASHYTSLYETYDRDAIKAVLETVDNTEESVAAAIQTINDNYTAAPPPGPP